MLNFFYCFSYWTRWLWCQRGFLTSCPFYALHLLLAVISLSHTFPQRINGRRLFFGYFNFIILLSLLSLFLLFFLLNPLTLVSMLFLASCPFYVFPLSLAVISLSHAFPRLLWGEGGPLAVVEGAILPLSLFCHPEGNLLPVRISFFSWFNFLVFLTFNVLIVI